MIATCHSLLPQLHAARQTRDCCLNCARSCTAECGCGPVGDVRTRVCVKTHACGVRGRSCPSRRLRPWHRLPRVFQYFQGATSHDFRPRVRPKNLRCTQPNQGRRGRTPPLSRARGARGPSPAGRVRHSPKSLNDGQDTRANTRLVRYYYTNGYACIACTRDRCGLRREAGLTRLKLKTRRHTIQRRRSVRFMQAGGPRGAWGLQMTNGNRPARSKAANVRSPSVRRRSAPWRRRVENVNVYM